MPEDRFRKAAKDGRTLLNAWLTLNSPFLIELIGQAGWDCVSIDQQHGLGGNEAMVQCLTSAKASNMPALVRVAENDLGLVGRALDAGAQGVICPLITTVEDAEAFVQAVKFPPRGHRSWGPYRARLGHDGDYFTTANDWTIACPQIETKGALASLDEILALDRVPEQPDASNAYARLAHPLIVGGGEIVVRDDPVERSRRLLRLCRCGNHPHRRGDRREDEKHSLAPSSSRSSCRNRQPNRAPP